MITGRRNGAGIAKGNGTAGRALPHAPCICSQCRKTFQEVVEKRKGVGANFQPQFGEIQQKLSQSRWQLLNGFLRIWNWGLVGGLLSPCAEGVEQQAEQARGSRNPAWVCLHLKTFACLEPGRVTWRSPMAVGGVAGFAACGTLRLPAGSFLLAASKCSLDRFLKYGRNQVVLVAGVKLAVLFCLSNRLTWGSLTPPSLKPIPANQSNASPDAEARCGLRLLASGLQCYSCNVMVGSRSVNTGCSSPEVITCPRSHQGFKHRFCIKMESVDTAVVRPKGLDAFPWNPELVAGWDVGQWCRLCFCSHRKGTAAWSPQS
ncbi:uncharacterized protein PHA67_001825 isoform 2-T7 [Liasis olivaceus]